MYEIESIFLNHPVLFYNKCAVGRCLHSVFRQNLSPQRLLRIFFCMQVTKGAHLNGQVSWHLKNSKSYRRDGDGQIPLTEVEDIN